MSLIIVRAFATLLLFDLYLLRGNFQALYNRVRNCSGRREIPMTDTIDKVSSAVENACMWYPKRVLCLQRSATLTCLLRKSGVRAEMVLGVQQLPFRAHAWVEVNGSVVNDKPYVSEIYAVWDRC